MHCYPLLSQAILDNLTGPLQLFFHQHNHKNTSLLLLLLAHYLLLHSRISSLFFSDFRTRTGPHEIQLKRQNVIHEREREVWLVYGHTYSMLWLFINLFFRSIDFNLNHVIIHRIGKMVYLEKETNFYFTLHSCSSSLKNTHTHTHTLTNLCSLPFFLSFLLSSSYSEPSLLSWKTAVPLQQYQMMPWQKTNQKSTNKWMMITIISTNILLSFLLLQFSWSSFPLL